MPKCAIFVDNHLLRDSVKRLHILSLVNEQKRRELFSTSGAFV